MDFEYAVFGNPVAHSLSPQIHEAFAAQHGGSIRYGRILSTAENLADDLDAFFRQGGQGANITVPFKETAARLCAKLSENARRAGAANTLARMHDGRLFGENTDGIGLAGDLKRLCGGLSGLKILVFGAGGAARGVLPALTGAGARVFIANRTAARAQELAALFGVQFADEDALSGSWDIIVNATSASLGGELPMLPEKAYGGALAYDMAYGAKPTVFMEHAERCGAASVSDGLGMLVGQGAAAYALWRGFLPDTESVIRQIRAELSKK